MSEIQKRIALEKAMRHQLNLICDEFPVFAAQHDIEMSQEALLEADEKEGAVLTIETSLSGEQAELFTNQFNRLYSYPNAKIRFTVKNS